MTRILVENIVKAINHELGNCSVYAVIEFRSQKYNCYEPITYLGDSISFVDDYNKEIKVDCKLINSIKIEEM